MQSQKSPETSLKRTQFAQSIRLEHRERIKKQIRQRYNEPQQHSQIHIHMQIGQGIEGGEYFDQEEFRKLRYQCRKSGFGVREVGVALGCLFGNVRALATESSMKFVDEVSERLEHNTDQLSQKLLTQTKTSLQSILQLQLQLQSPQKSPPSTQLSQLHILKSCFDGLLQLLQKYKLYHQLWIPFSLLKNEELRKYGLVNFQNFVVRHVEGFTSEEISVVGFVLGNFLEEGGSSGGNGGGSGSGSGGDWGRILWVIDVLLKKYYIRPYDCIKLIDCLIDLLSQPNLQQKLQILCDETCLIQNLTSYLDKSKSQVYKTNFDLAGKLGYFIARIYSSNNEELCMKIYMKNVMVVGYIRSWLPVPIGVSVPMLEAGVGGGNGGLVHANHKCTAYLVYALTNIVVTDPGFLQAILVKSDIYRALVYMYRLVPVSCRQQISICLYNMTFVSDTGSLRIMLQTKLPQIITQMLKQSNSLILIKSLGMINIICKALDQDIPHNTNSNGSNTNSNVTHAWLYSRKKFQIVLDTLGAIKLMESLVHSPEDQIVGVAVSGLELLMSV